MLESNSGNAICMELINQEASEQFARQLANCLSTPLVIGFSGDIGTGKTTIIRAMLQHLGIQSAIKSPTFSLVESYQLSDSFVLHHFDLYRIHHEDELDYLGFRDYFSPSSVCCIEWAEKAGKALPYLDIRFTLKIKGAGREVYIETMTSAGNHLLTCLVGDS